MSKCEKCKDKVCIVMGKPCQEVELLLRKEGIFGSKWHGHRISSKQVKKERNNRLELTDFREIPFSQFDYDDEDNENPYLVD